MNNAGNHNRNFNTEDIRRYLSGEMSNAEMHALEKAALEDPFLAEALEGYETHIGRNLSADLDEMRERLREKTSGKILPIIPAKKIWYRYVAAAVLVLIAGSGAYLILNQKTGPASVAVESATKKNEPSITADTIQSAHANSMQDSGKTGVTKSSPSNQKTLKKSEDKSVDQASADNNAPSKASVQEIDRSKPNEGQLKKQPVSDDLASAKAKEKESDGEEKKLNETALSREPAAAQAAKADRGNIQGFIGTHLFTGKVVDKDGHPLPFVNVRVNNSNSFSYTNAAGEFKLISGDTALELQFKSVGFKAKQARVGLGDGHNRIILDSDLNKALRKSLSNAVRKDMKADSLANEKIEAEPSDGWDSYDIYLVNNIRSPKNGPPVSAGGIVELSFTVNKNGTLTNFRIDRSLDPYSDKEAIRLVKEGPRWELTSGDQPARVSLTIFF